MVIFYKGQWKIVIKTTEVKIIEWKMRRKMNSHYSSIFLLSSFGYVLLNISIELNQQYNMLPKLCSQMRNTDQTLKYTKLKLLSW